MSNRSTTQRDLFDRFHEAVVQPPAPPHSGPITSRAAAQRIRSTANVLRMRVLEFIAGQGEVGATDEEIQRGLDMAGNTERPRRGELAKMGLIVDSGRTRRTASGRQAVVWIATTTKTSNERTIP